MFLSKVILLNIFSDKHNQRSTKICRWKGLNDWIKYIIDLQYLCDFLVVSLANIDIKP
jgi:hypothetical protein